MFQCAIKVVAFACSPWQDDPSNNAVIYRAKVRSKRTLSATSLSDKCRKSLDAVSITVHFEAATKIFVSWEISPKPGNSTSRFVFSVPFSHTIHHLALAARPQFLRFIIQNNPSWSVYHAFAHNVLLVTRICWVGRPELWSFCGNSCAKYCRFGPERFLCHKSWCRVKCGTRIPVALLLGVKKEPGIPHVKLRVLWKIKHRTPLKDLWCNHGAAADSKAIEKAQLYSAKQLWKKSGHSIKMEEYGFFTMAYLRFCGFQVHLSSTRNQSYFWFV